MIPLWRGRWSFTIALLLAITLTPSPRVEGQTSSVTAAFKVEDPLKFTYPTQNSQSNEISFLILSTREDITGVKAGIVQLKDPNGRTLPLDSKSVTAPDSVTGKGAVVKIMLKPEWFVTSGDYTLLLSLIGVSHGKPVPNDLAKLTISHPAPELALDELNNTTLRLYRPMPYCSASSTTSMLFRLNTQGTVLRDVTVTGGPIFVKDTHIAAEGVLQPGFSKNVPVADISAAGQSVGVKCDGVRDVGSFTSSLIVTSPALPTSKIIPLILIVTDQPWLPFITIFLGVLGSWAVNHFLTVKRPSYQSALRIVQLREQLEYLRGFARDAQKKERLRRLAVTLEGVQDRIDMDDLGNGPAQLDDVGKELDAIRQGDVDQSIRLHADIARMRSEWESISKIPAVQQTQEEKQTLPIVDENLKQADEMLNTQQVDAAGETLQAVQKSLAQLRKERLNYEIEILRTDLLQQESDITGFAEEITELKANLKTAEDKISANELDAAENALVAFRSLWNAVKKATVPKQGIRAETQSLPVFSVMTVTAPAPRPRVVVLEVVSQISSKETLHFNLAEVTTRIGDKFNWDFGDSTTLSTTKSFTEHIYDKSGTYTVRCALERANDKGVILMAPMELHVAPGQAEQTTAGIKWRIRSGDWAVVGVSLLLAAFTGYISLYADKPFGSGKDYLLAVIWGFGVDTTVRGFNQISRQITTTGASKT